MTKYFLILFFYFMSFVNTASAADCYMQHFTFNFGMDSQTISTVKSGKLCSVSINPTGAGIDQIIIAQPARHGIVGLSGKYKWSYKSNSGFVGKDYYIIQFSGESMGNNHQHSVFSGTTNISVVVDVVP